VNGTNVQMGRCVVVVGIRVWHIPCVKGMECGTLCWGGDRHNCRGHRQSWENGRGLDRVVTPGRSRADMNGTGWKVDGQQKGGRPSLEQGRNLEI